jgi:hypothetical protein
MKSFGGKAQLTSYFISAQKERIETVSKRRIEPHKKGGEEEREEQNANHKRTHHKSNPGGHEEVSTSIPAAIFGFYTNSPIMDLSHKKT